MLKANAKRGFTLVEILVTVTILAILTSFLIPTYIHMVHETERDTDIAKFESICSAFKKAMGEPEVQKAMAELSNDGDEMKVVCYIDNSGVIKFGEGQLIGPESNDTLETTALWLNTYQTVGVTYTVSSPDFYGKYLVFRMTPKTYKTTATCEYEITDSRP